MSTWGTIFGMIFGSGIAIYVVFREFYLLSTAVSRSSFHLLYFPTQVPRAQTNRAALKQLLHISPFCTLLHFLASPSAFFSSTHKMQCQTSAALMLAGTSAIPSTPSNCSLFPQFPIIKMHGGLITFFVFFAFVAFAWFALFFFFLGPHIALSITSCLRGRMSPLLHTYMWPPNSPSSHSNPPPATLLSRNWVIVVDCG